MAITFDQARERAQALAHDWQGPGSFYVAPYGFEDASDYLVIVGAREVITGTDPTMSVADDEQILVDKASGILRRANALDELEHDWAPVGNWLMAPAEPEGIQIQE